VAADDEELHHLCNNTIYPKKKVTSQNSSLFLVYISTTEEKIETINSVSLKMIFPLVVQYELTGDITVMSNVNQKRSYKVRGLASRLGSS